MTYLTRRRFIITAAATALPLKAGAAPLRTEWRGRALGAEARVVLLGMPEAKARRLFARITGEVERIERALSLYDAGSELSRLNRDGVLARPGRDMTAIMGLSDQVHDATDGMFDPTIQPLFSLYAASAGSPDPARLAAALDATGWHGMDRRDGGIRLQKGMALSFNGIAQGYAADRVAALLRAAGADSVLIDMGEIAAIGPNPGQPPFSAGIAGPGGEIVAEVPLRNTCLATSAPRGTVFDAAGRVGHILDPKRGASVDSWSIVSVSAPIAAIADGLSTAFCGMSRPTIDAALARFPGAKLEAIA
ncbi:MAG: FAD:protein FMN transferase [Rhodobacteraceae bacterium]|nr:FAD:protein FMN transferase [Paracoccaceae bacterium]